MNPVRTQSADITRLVTAHSALNSRVMSTLALFSAPRPVPGPAIAASTAWTAMPGAASGCGEAGAPAGAERTESRESPVKTRQTTNNNGLRTYPPDPGSIGGGAPVFISGGTGASCAIACAAGVPGWKGGKSSPFAHARTCFRMRPALTEARSRMNATAAGSMTSMPRARMARPTVNWASAAVSRVIPRAMPIALNRVRPENRASATIPTSPAARRTRHDPALPSHAGTRSSTRKRG